MIGRNDRRDRGLWLPGLLDVSPEGTTISAETAQPSRYGAPRRGCN